MTLGTLEMGKAMSCEASSTVPRLYTELGAHFGCVGMGLQISVTGSRLNVYKFFRP
jgi:hypothetical protein